MHNWWNFFGPDNIYEVLGSVAAIPIVLHALRKAWFRTRQQVRTAIRRCREVFVKGGVAARRLLIAHTAIRRCREVFVTRGVAGRRLLSVHTVSQ